jgi:hypothetical protein
MRKWEPTVGYLKIVEANPGVLSCAVLKKCG